MTELKTVLEIALLMETMDAPENETKAEKDSRMRETFGHFLIEDFATAITLIDIGHAVIERLKDRFPVPEEN